MLARIHKTFSSVCVKKTLLLEGRCRLDARSMNIECARRAVRGVAGALPASGAAGGSSCGGRPADGGRHETHPLFTQCLLKPSAVRKP